MINLQSIKKGKKNLIMINKAELARRIGRSRTWVTLVMNGNAPGKRSGEPTKRLIAEALDIPYEKLFGKK